MHNNSELEKMRRDGNFVKAEKLLASGALKAAESLMRLAARRGNSFARIELSRMYLRKSDRWDGRRENLSKLTEFFSGKSGTWANAMALICNNVSDQDVTAGLTKLQLLAASGDGDASYYLGLCVQKAWAKSLLKKDNM